MEQLLVLSHTWVLMSILCAPYCMCSWAETLARLLGVQLNECGSYMKLFNLPRTRNNRKSTGGLNNSIISLNPLMRESSRIPP